MIGLKKGDKGEEVKAVQVLVQMAGHGDALGRAGIDGDYGDKTAEGVRLCRKDAGSKAEAGYGDVITAHAYGQLHEAAMAGQLKKLLGSAGTSVPKNLVVDSVTTKRLSVG